MHFQFTRQTMDCNARSEDQEKLQIDDQRLISITSCLTGVKKQRADSTWLPGGILSLFKGKQAQYILDKSKIKDLKGRWNVIKMKIIKKIIMIITIYQLVDGSGSGIYKVKSKLDKLDKVQSAKEHCKKMLVELLEIIKKQQDLDDIIIARDFN